MYGDKEISKLTRVSSLWKYWDYHYSIWRRLPFCNIVYVLIAGGDAHNLRDTIH